MLNMNFVPDDYIRNNESARTNLMYLVLLLVVMVGLGGAFATIKIRQRALDTKEELVNAKMARAQEAIRQFEELQTKRKMMMKTALTTAELLEPVPRSVLLASLTNNLPNGVSLLRLKLIQKEPKKPRQSAATTSKYQKAQAKKTAPAVNTVSREKLLETSIDIEGVAPSDLQVASYIENLSSSALLDNVALVESKEYKSKTDRQGHSKSLDALGATYRRFKLTAKLRKDVHLSKEDIVSIRSGAEDERGGVQL